MAIRRDATPAPEQIRKYLQKKQTDTAPPAFPKEDRRTTRDLHRGSGFNKKNRQPRREMHRNVDAHHDDGPA